MGRIRWLWCNLAAILLERFTVAVGTVLQAQVTVVSQPIQPILTLFSLFFPSEIPISGSKGFVVIWCGWGSQEKLSQALLTGSAVVLQMLNRGGRAINLCTKLLIGFPGLPSDVLLLLIELGFGSAEYFRRVSLLHADRPSASEMRRRNWD